MDRREKLIVGLQSGRTVIQMPMLDVEEDSRAKLNAILDIFGLPYVPQQTFINGGYISFDQLPLRRVWRRSSWPKQGAVILQLRDVHSILFSEDEDSEKLLPTIENLRAGRVAVSWVGRPPIALIALISLAFPEDCINGLGYRKGPISNDPEHDGEWDHFPDFPGPIYHIARFKKDFDRVAYTFTEKTKSRHDKNKNLPFRQVEVPQFDPEYFLQRDSHTGTQLAETISDFDEQVKRVVRQMLFG